MESVFYKKLKDILNKDSRYKLEAYEFLMQALFFTQSKLSRQGHVCGKELLFGIKEYGVRQFGSLALSVFENWGVKKTDDFGNIVFNLIKQGLLKKTEEDSIDDFKGVYDFKVAFEQEQQRRLSEDIKRELGVQDDSGKKNDKKV